MFAVMLIGISFPFAWLTLKSRSLWPAVLLHAGHNQFILGIFDKLTATTNATPYITGEFGIGLALTTVIVAYLFWRMQREKLVRTQPIQAQPVVKPEQSGTL